MHFRGDLILCCKEVCLSAYLVKLVRYNWLYIAAWHINLSAIIVEIDTSHSVQNGPHDSSLSSILTLLKERKIFTWVSR